VLSAEDFGLTFLVLGCLAAAETGGDRGRGSRN
jgi:hypothetical protein